jgi:hypothetical protein
LRRGWFIVGEIEVGGGGSWPNGGWRCDRRGWRGDVGGHEQGWRHGRDEDKAGMKTTRAEMETRTGRMKTTEITMGSHNHPIAALHVFFVMFLFPAVNEQASQELSGFSKCFSARRPNFPAIVYYSIVSVKELFLKSSRLFTEAVFLLENLLL